MLIMFNYVVFHEVEINKFELSNLNNVTFLQGVGSASTQQPYSFWREIVTSLEVAWDWSGIPK